MPSMFHKKSFIGYLLLAGAQQLVAAEIEPALVTTPRANALENTAASRPFLAAARTQQPVNLAARGYVEREHLVRGLAGAAEPYVTRLLLRRPLDASRFSGRVIVELLHATGPYETAPLWSLSWEHFTRRGDAWIGLTMAPAAIAALQKFNVARYVALSLPADSTSHCGVARPDAVAADVVAQVGALLRSSSKENPLLDLGPQRLLLAGHADSGNAVADFASGPHRALRLGDGEPIFDGYLNLSGLVAVSPACAASLPRGVPFVSVLTEADARLVPERSDGEVQSEGLRVFTIAGTDGARPLPTGAPGAADLVAAGVAALASTACREPLKDLALAHALNAVWQQIEDLLVLKVPLAVQMADLQLPGAQAAGTDGKPACSAVTGSLRFDAAALKRTYRTRAEYLRRFGAAADQAVLARLLVKEDADALKATAAKVLPPF